MTGLLVLYGIIAFAHGFLRVGITKKEERLGILALMTVLALVFWPCIWLLAIRRPPPHAVPPDRGVNG